MYIFLYLCRQNITIIMKKITVIILAALLNVCAAMAVPAYKGKVILDQPDGTTVTARIHGDEWLNFTTTEDGYSIVRNADGYLVYADRAEGKLVPTTRIAHDAARRTADEQSWLAGHEKYLAPAMSTHAKKAQSEEFARRAKARTALKASHYDYNKFRGLIILVQYNNREFEREDYADIVNGMVNEENYTGYVDSNNRKQTYTGSVLDYFTDNSFGKFKPTFDIVGPVTVDYADDYAQHTDYAAELVNEALNLADEQVDFSDYDGDDDGTVDMVYFIFAGFGANFLGDSSDYIWPHASQVYDPNTYRAVWKDNVKFGRYACSTEFYGIPRSYTIDGIGTICHEFSHVLGLMDHYDTNYEEDGQSNDPGEWDVMAGGSYHNIARTPCGYSLFERYSIGFATPQTIDAEGSYTLEDIDQVNTGYLIQSQQNKEYFLLENRRNYKWNAYLPNTGMLVFRVDSTSTRPWSYNTVNANPNHNYYEMVRANGYHNGANASDPFPGSKRVTELNNVTEPANLLSWTGKETKWGLTNIRETNGVITFDIEDTYQLKSISIDEEITIGVGTSRPIELIFEPSYVTADVTWTSANPDIATVTNEGVVSGISTGTTTITVTTVDGKFSATCTVNVEEQLTVGSIAEFKELEDGSKCILTLNNAEVLYVYKTNIYVRDASGAIVLVNTGVTAKNNNRINGTIYLQKTTSNNMPAAIAVENQTTTTSLAVTTGTSVKPREIAPEDITTADYADYLYVKKAQVTIDGGAWIVCGDHRMRLYNTFGVRNIKVPSDFEGKLFNIKCIYGTNILNDEVIDELYLMANLEEVSFPVAADIAEAKEMEGDNIIKLMLDNAQVLAIDEEEGDIIVRDASGALAIEGIGLDLQTQVNDILNGSVLGTYSYEDGMPYFLKEDGLTTTSTITVSEGAEAEPIVATITELNALSDKDFETSPLNCNLVKLQNVLIKPFMTPFYNAVDPENSKNTIMFTNAAFVGVSIPKNTGNNTYDLTGIFGYNIEDGESMRFIGLTREPELNTVDAIELQNASETDKTPVYNLAGQRVTKAYKGIVIRNGKAVSNK